MEYIATIKKTQAICAQYQLYTKKKFGQNFIIEPKVVEKIARTAIEASHYSVIEIGPGIGALTQFLCHYAQKVYCFEIDETLKKYWQDQNIPNLEVIFDDFLKYDLNNFFKNHHKEEFIVAANLPYYITTPLLFKLFEYPFHKITVMMQKEVAQRFSAKVNSKDYNALSVIAQFKYDIKIEFPIAKTIFMPAPNVDSSVISFKPKPRVKINESQFNEFVHMCFQQRRKTLVNNLSKYPKELVVDILEKCNIKLNQRAQELTIDQFVMLYEYFEK